MAIVVAVVLSLTATLLLGGFACFHPVSSAGMGNCRPGDPCCASPGK